MAILRQSTAYTRMFMMIDSSDHFSPKTGLTVAVTLSKAGGSFASAGGSITEVANGFYKLALSTTDTNTLGDLAYHCTSSGADNTDFVDQVSVRILDDLCFPTTSGRSLDVTATGEAGIDWSNVGAPTTTLALTGTTIAATQKVDVDTIKTNAVVNGGTITFPTNATVASTTNITAGTISGLAANTITATSIAADAITAAKVADGTIDAATFAAGAIDATAIADGAIDAATLASNTITAAKIAANAIGASQLATDAVTEIWANACTEPTAVVAASPTAIAAISWLLTLSRNKITQTATTQTILADDGSTTIAASTVSDDATTFTRGEFA